MAFSNIDKPSKYFNTVTYTGTGSLLSITGVGFQPDWVWIKGRSGATDHGLYDAVRGVQKDLVSNSTSAETTQTTGLTAFGTDGFTVGALAKLNTSAATYCSWNWLGANTTVSNTAGTITSTVSANTTSGFSIVSYTGAGGASTVGHGLGVIPRMIILKGRSNARIWVIGHGSLGWTKYMSFDTAAAATNNYWNDTTPTSSVFSVFNSVNVNGSGETYIAYCFAEIKGYSKFGSYTGNGVADGPFVYTGFRPRFILIKRTDVTDYWIIFDSVRNTYNVANLQLYPNLTDAETTGVSGLLDILSNGFKSRGGASLINASGGTYIYMAFAENPFTSSKGIPCTAR